MQGHTKHHIYLGDTKIATLNDSGSLYFTISDHLGSSTLMTNASGALSELDDYYPYGAVAYENTTTDLDNWYKFTGKELDSETNLQYFGARYYDNNLGRFTSIDPLLLEDTGVASKLYDPQSLNTYAYARNNPIILIDPDGRDPITATLLTIGFIVAGGVLLQNIQPAQAPQSSQAIMCYDLPSEKNIGDVMSKTYNGLPWQSKLGVTLVAGGMTSAVQNGVERVFVKSINKWVTKEASEIASSRALQGVWYNSSFDTVEDSMLYHYTKHVTNEGLDKTLVQYTRDARAFWRKLGGDIVKGNAIEGAAYEKTILKDKTEGYLIRTTGGEGGYFKPNGDIVTFWYDNK